jgi:hypothetical protein
MPTKDIPQTLIHCFPIQIVIFKSFICLIKRLFLNKTWLGIYKKEDGNQKNLAMACIHSKEAEK